MILLLIFIAFMAHTKASHQWDNLTITIAVVEYQPILDNSISTDDRILANAAKIIQLLNSINETSLDMVIFPEATLRTDPETAVEMTLKTNPCDDDQNYPSFIHDLSCAARNSSTYLVINLLTKVKCETPSLSENCKNLGYFLYNTDAIFDRDGLIVTLYHKYNLFGEKSYTDMPQEPEEVVVETDFGVKFGIFTCFDILFKSPAQDLLTDTNVDAIIYPTMWHSDLPFLTAIQTQQMWAHTHNVKLFASGINNPVLASGGTGVYDGARGTVFADIIAKGGSKIYIYKQINGELQTISNDEDIDVLGKEMDSFPLTSDPLLIDYNSTVLDLSKKEFNEELCYNGGEENRICCDFTIKLSTGVFTREKNVYTYHMVAYSGLRSYNEVYNASFEVCGVVACLNSSLSSCGRRFPKYDDIDWPVKFEEIVIRASFEHNENKTQFPNSLLSSVRPINANLVNWEGKEVKIDDKKFMERIFSLKEPQDRILTFAIIGRNFDRDSPLITNDF